MVIIYIFFFYLEIFQSSNFTNSYSAGRKYQFGNAGQMWGFLKLLPLSRLHDPKNGYIVNNTCEISIEVTCKVTAEAADDEIKEKSTSGQDSRART